MPIGSNPFYQYYRSNSLPGDHRSAYLASTTAFTALLHPSSNCINTTVDHLKPYFYQNCLTMLLWPIPIEKLGDVSNCIKLLENREQKVYRIFYFILYCLTNHRGEVLIKVQKVYSLYKAKTLTFVSKWTGCYENYLPMITQSRLTHSSSSALINPTVRLSSRGEWHHLRGHNQREASFDYAIHLIHLSPLPTASIRILLPF